MIEGKIMRNEKMICLVLIYSCIVIMDDVLPTILSLIHYHLVPSDASVVCSQDALSASE